MKGNVRDIYTVFDGNDKELIIPVYQRNYDWGEKQCERLFDDLIEVIEKDRPKHFFGAVVGKADTAFQWVVIDGQQRLTTTSLLMLALSNSIADGTVEADEPGLARKIRANYLEGGASSYSAGTKLKLKPVKDDLNAYRRLLDGDEPNEKSSVTANYRYFRQRIAEGRLTGDEIWAAICRLEAMVLDLESHDDPQRIFESLNSTGKELKESDKIRNLVLMGMPAKDQEHLYEYFWNPIERNVGFDTDAFVRLYLVSRTRKTPNMNAVYDAFRRFLSTSGEDTRSILQSMRDYSEHFRDLNNAATGVPRADARLRRLNILRHEVAMPALMPLLGDHRGDEVSSEDFADTIGIFDAYIFRRLVVGVPSNSLNKIFATLYTEAKRLRPEGTPVSEVISYLLLRRADTSGRFPDDEEFGTAFSTRNFYNFTTANRRYLFECLENRNSKETRDIADRIEKGDLTVEHVMPQTLTKDWREELGPDSETTHSTWLHRIGNLTVTGYNSEYSNSAFTTKRTLPGGFEESPFWLNHSIRATERWNGEAIAARTTLLTNEALKYWPLLNSNFEPLREPLPTVPMGDDTSFVNRLLVSFEFEETTQTVTSFKDMLLLVIKALLASRREEIILYASGGGYGFVFGQQSNRYQEEIAPSLWVTTSNATNDKISILRALFRHLGIDTDTLILTLRPYDAPSPKEEEESPYAELTKFIPQIEAFEGTAVNGFDIEELQSEFSAAFAEFQSPDPQSVLVGRDLVTLARPDVVAELSVEEVLAAITLMMSIDSVMPGVVLSSVHNGSIARWLKRISELTGSTPGSGRDASAL